MKYVKFALFVGAFIFALTFFTAETDAAGYDATFGGLVIYLSKAEATKVAQSLEDGRNAAGLVAIGAGWIPQPILARGTQTILGLSAWKANQLATSLNRCGRNGARLTIPWPIGTGGAARAAAGMSVANR